MEMEIAGAFKNARIADRPNSFSKQNSHPRLFVVHLGASGIPVGSLHMP
jgi:hypothetical protein